LACTSIILQKISSFESQVTLSQNLRINAVEEDQKYRSKNVSISRMSSLMYHLHAEPPLKVFSAFFRKTTRDLSAHKAEK
jgi:hypothetical protein